MASTEKSAVRSKLSDTYGQTPSPGWWSGAWTKLKGYYGSAKEALFGDDTQGSNAIAKCMLLAVPAAVTAALRYVIGGAVATVPGLCVVAAVSSIVVIAAGLAAWFIYSKITKVTDKASELVEKARDFADGTMSNATQLLDAVSQSAQSILPVVKCFRDVGIGLLIYFIICLILSYRGK